MSSSHGRRCDDREDYESAGAKKAEAEAERERLPEGVMGGAEMVGPFGCDRREDRQPEGATDLLGRVHQTAGEAVLTVCHTGHRENSDRHEREPQPRAR